jgi:anaerobic ribonucleoside-triphosphate reductase activating protein
MQLNLAGFVKYSTVNGPGKRAVVWVQGCTLRCDGCFNPGFQPFLPRSVVSPLALADEISGIGTIEGVTFTGGEPFCQATALAEVGRLVRDVGLNVVTFSGFPYATLLAKRRRSWDSLLRVTDLLIAGPYCAGLERSHPLLSSSNQEMVLLSGQFTGRVDAFGKAANVEYIIRPGGEIIATGFPENDILPAFSMKGEQQCHISPE